jgi:hypothetical protein
MRRLAALVVLLSACSKQGALNYRHCLKLRIGMTREEVFKTMGQPEDTFPYVEGKSLPNQKGRTAYEWSTPASMPAPARVSIEDATGKAESIRCSDAVVTAAVFVEPPAPAVSTAALDVSTLSSPPRAAAPQAPRSAPRERSSSNASSTGKPLTE